MKFLSGFRQQWTPKNSIHLNRMSRSEIIYIQLTYSLSISQTRNSNLPTVNAQILNKNTSETDKVTAILIQNGWFFKAITIIFILFKMLRNFYARPSLQTNRWAEKSEKYTRPIRWLYLMFFKLELIEMSKLPKLRLTSEWSTFFVSRYVWVRSLNGDSVTAKYSYVYLTLTMLEKEKALCIWNIVLNADTICFIDNDGRKKTYVFNRFYLSIDQHHNIFVCIEFSSFNFETKNNHSWKSRKRSVFTTN